MSRTNRRDHFKPSKGRVARDGHEQRHSRGCRNNNSCDYCRRNRTFQTRRIEAQASAEPVQETNGE